MAPTANGCCYRLATTYANSTVTSAPTDCQPWPPPDQPTESPASTADHNAQRPASGQATIQHPNVSTDHPSRIAGHLLTRLLACTAPFTARRSLGWPAQGNQ